MLSTVFVIFGIIILFMAYNIDKSCAMTANAISSLYSEIQELKETVEDLESSIKSLKDKDFDFSLD